MKLDKRGRPAFYCVACSGRCFLNTMLAYGGFLSVSDYVDEKISASTPQKYRSDVLEYAAANQMPGLFGSADSDPAAD